MTGRSEWARSRIVVIVAKEQVEARAAIGRALRSDGHEVIEVGDGTQLLARLMSLVALGGRRRESIAVVASADRSVLAVLDMLHAARWRTPVVLVSDETSPPGRELAALARFCRPLDLAALRAAVWRAVPPEAA